MKYILILLLLPLVGIAQAPDTTFYPTMKGDSTMYWFTERMYDLMRANFQVSDFGLFSGLRQVHYLPDGEHFLQRWNPDSLINTVIKDIRRAAVLYDQYLSEKYDELMWYYQVGYYVNKNGYRIKIGMIP